MSSHRTKEDEKRVDEFFSIDVVIGGFSKFFSCLLACYIFSFIHS